MLLEEVTEFIGKSEETVIMEVEKGAIKRFADAIDDPNPLYWDDEYARSSRFGSIIAPPGFFGWPATSRAKTQWFFGWPAKWEAEGRHFSRLAEELKVILTEAGYTRNMVAELDYEFFSPVRAGDILSAAKTIKDVYERQGKTGKLVFVVLETTYTNQNGDLVAKERHIGVF